MYHANQSSNQECFRTMSYCLCFGSFVMHMRHLGLGFERCALNWDYRTPTQFQAWVDYKGGVALVNVVCSKKVGHTET